MDIDTNALEWKLRKLGENIDMLNHALYLRRMKPMHDLVRGSREQMTRGLDYYDG